MSVLVMLVTLASLLMMGDARWSDAGEVRHAVRACSGALHVFAASDRPTIIYSSNRKLLYSNLNENEVRAVARLAQHLPQTLLLSKGCAGTVALSI